MKLRYFLLVSLCWSALSGKELETLIEYEVSYLGIPLLDMTLNWVEDDTSIYVSYDNQLKPFIAYFHPVHNIYQVHFRNESFEPLTWSKSVSEGEMHFQINAHRSKNGNKVYFQNGDSLDFPAGGFTVFSATHYLASKASDADFFPVKLPIFIDGQVWEASASRFDTQQPHPDYELESGDILIQTDLHYLSGESIVPVNDILTSVIATEGTQFLLWVSPDGIYNKAQFGKFPKAVVLKQVSN